MPGRDSILYRADRRHQSGESSFFRNQLTSGSTAMSQDLSRNQTSSQRRLCAPEGIIVYPNLFPNPSRIPTLGLRALVRNELSLIIDGKQREVTLRVCPRSPV